MTVKTLGAAVLATVAFLGVALGAAAGLAAALGAALVVVGLATGALEATVLGAVSFLGGAALGGSSFGSRSFDSCRFGNSLDFRRFGRGFGCGSLALGGFGRDSLRNCNSLGGDSLCRCDLGIGLWLFLRILFLPFLLQILFDL